MPTTLRGERARGGAGLEERGIVGGGATHRHDVEVVGREQLDRVGRVDVDQLVTTIDAGRDEVVAESTILIGIIEPRHGDERAVTRREAQRGRRVMRQAEVTRSLVGERHAQARDGDAAERRAPRRAAARPPCR